MGPSGSYLPRFAQLATLATKWEDGADSASRNRPRGLGGRPSPRESIAAFAQRKTTLGRPVCAQCLAKPGCLTFRFAAQRFLRYTVVRRRVSVSGAVDAGKDLGPSGNMGLPIAVAQVALFLWSREMPTSSPTKTRRNATPLTGQHADEIQRFGTVVPMPIGLSEQTRRESAEFESDTRRHDYAPRSLQKAPLASDRSDVLPASPLVR